MAAPKFNGPSQYARHTLTVEIAGKVGLFVREQARQRDMTPAQFVREVLGMWQEGQLQHAHVARINTPTRHDGYIEMPVHIPRSRVAQWRS